MGFSGGSVVKNPPAIQEMWIQSLGQEHPLEKEMATHSSILAWEIPQSGMGDSPQSCKSQTWLRDLTHIHIALHAYTKEKTIARLKIKTKSIIQ